jgi:hypothetical protein
MNYLKIDDAYHVEEIEDLIVTKFVISDIITKSSSLKSFILTEK